MKDSIKIIDFLRYLSGDVSQDIKVTIEEFALENQDNLQFLTGLKELRKEFDSDEEVVSYLEESKKSMYHKVFKKTTKKESILKALK